MSYAMRSLKDEECVCLRSFQEVFHLLPCPFNESFQYHLLMLRFILDRLQLYEEELLLKLKNEMKTNRDAKNVNKVINFQF